jgi:hypothetical protein
MMLYRTTCPETTVLGEYELGMLDKPLAAKIADHLGGCPHCRSELEGLRTYLAELKPDISFSLTERVRVLIAELLPRPGANQLLRPAFAVRGNSSPLIEYQAGETSLSLEVEPDPVNEDRRMLMGLMMGAGGIGWSASLWSHGNPLDKTGVDELGNFILSGLAPGEYDLILSGEDVEIHVQSLAVA